YWLLEFHIDAIRVDAVASMLYLDYSREPGEWQPNVHGGRENLEAIGFLQELNATIYKQVPGAFTIAEESTSWPGVTQPTDVAGLGFGFKWNMGWMHDTLSYLNRDPAHRSYHHNELTFSIVYAFSENYVLPISHDEVVHEKGSLLRKMPGDRWRQFANVRAFLAYMWAHPGKQLIFMGTEFAQDNEWAEARELDWHLLHQGDHRGVQKLIRDLNEYYATNPALWSRDSDPAGFQWLDGGDAARNTIAFIRWSHDQQPLVCITNFAAIPHEEYRLGLPWAGEWAEVINTDAEDYGGSGVGNLGSVTALQVPYQGQPASASLRVPPLGSLWLAPPPIRRDRS
ncbi:MAG TPA: 1,4-alpha-glucan branching enzyme, partial [Marmoricola sp.]|nr:1,4-alpha-glucan branching enzyme [Marmoricola sp.]